MPSTKPTSGRFKIVSLEDESKPTSMPNGDGRGFPTVRLNDNVQVWNLTQQGNDPIYQLSLGDYKFTGVIEDKVTVSNFDAYDVKWAINYVEDYDAYTIKKNGTSKGWTVPDDLTSGSEAIAFLSHVALY